MALPLCDECGHLDASSAVREQGGERLCTTCFTHFNMIRNLDAALFTAQEEVRDLQREFDIVDGNRSVQYYLDNKFQIHRTPAVGNNFYVPSWEINYLLKDLKADNPGLGELARLSHALDLANLRVSKSEHRVHEIKATSRRIKDTITTKVHTELVLLRQCAAMMRPAVPIQRCEINICEPNDQSCHCEFLHSCSLVADEIDKVITGYEIAIDELGAWVKQIDELS